MKQETFNCSGSRKTAGSDQTEAEGRAREIQLLRRRAARLRAWQSDHTEGWQGCGWPAGFAEQYCARLGKLAKTNNTMIHALAD